MRVHGALALLVMAACTNSASGPTALFVAAGNGSDFYDLPFPNDLRRDEAGALDLSAFPTNSLIAGQYRDAAQTLDGFGLNAASFARFSTELDPASLPDPASSMQAGASVYLVDVDTASASYGLRTPIIATFRPDGTNTIRGNRLVVRPYPGYGLDEGTTYALVITNRVRAADGSKVEAAADFKAVLGSGGSSAIARARTTYAPLLAWLDSAGADPRADVISASVFTTQHATFMGPALRAGVFGTPAPVAAGITQQTTTSTAFTLWTGTYTAPNFQTGDVPYLSSGGEIQVANGVAVVQRPAEPMRFALTVPIGPTPATGWPICIYAHGTGGDYESFVDDGTGGRLAQQGIATISTDQVLHGPRNPGGDPAVSFFNFGNPYAGRDNALQGAADAWSQQRLALGMTFTDTASRTIKFDPDRVMFFGHSQGGLTGPAYVAFEPAVKGAVLSGTGGLLYLSMLYKLAPVDFPPLVETLTRDAPMDEDNPTIALAQMWIERADGANYARFMVREPQTPAGPRAIFQSEGFTDTYAPNPTIEAFATAIGGDLLLPDQQDVIGLTTLRGRAKVQPPVTTNVNGTTAILAQYVMAPGSDGHFVVFEVPAAEAQSSQFLGTLARTGQATVVSP